MRFYIALLIVNQLIFKCLSTTSELNNSDPKFSGPINNITVPVGRDGVLKCVVHDLVSFKLAWLRVDTQTILTIQNHVITKNHRISITHTEHRIWELRVRDVRETDRGWYMCQINTDPMKSQVGYLDVVVPPDINDQLTSNDASVQEGQNVTLTCTASGQPAPQIVWRREKDSDLLENGSDWYSIAGPNLTLWQVQRQRMGAYLCIASNGVPPTVSKRISLAVNFGPTIWTRYDTIYVGHGQRVVLECVTEAQPVSVNFWLKDSDYIQGGSYESLADYKTVMRLVLRPLKANDFGAYRCTAKNMLGEAERIITVHHRAKQHVQQTHHNSERGSQLILIEEYIQNAAAATNYAALLLQLCSCIYVQVRDILLINL